MSDLNDLSKNISKEKINELIDIASKKLGMSSSELRAIASDPKNADQLLSHLTKEKSEIAKSALNDPKVLERMINNNPQAKKFLNDILGEGKNGRK